MHMTLWQLDSILRGNYGRDRNLSTKVASSKEEWSYLASLFSEISKYYEAGDRDILDAELPEDFVKKVLDESGLVCYRFHDGSIRSYTYKDFDGDIIPATQVYLQYGGDVLERVFERSVAGDASDNLAIRKIMGTDKIKPENQ